MEDFEELYEKETGKKATYEIYSRRCPDRSDWYYYDSYVEWLENKLATKEK